MKKHLSNLLLKWDYIQNLHTAVKVYDKVAPLRCMLLIVLFLTS